MPVDEPHIDSDFTPGGNHGDRPASQTATLGKGPHANDRTAKADMPGKKAGDTIPGTPYPHKNSEHTVRPKYEYPRQIRWHNQDSDARIAVGGEGAIYLFNLMEGGIQRKVAVKALHIDESQSEALTRNITLNDTLSHPNICKIYLEQEYDKAKNLLLIPMEYIQGKDLGRWREQFPGQLAPLKELLPLLKQCADALDYVHEKEIVHKDIKPGNVMVNDRNEVKLLDFGLAERSHTEGAPVDYSSLGGTPLYMSPEQLQDNLNAVDLMQEYQKATLTGGCDQFSLAVMVYEMLSGHKPLEHVTNPDANDPMQISYQRKLLKTYREKWEYAPIKGMPKYVNRALKRALSLEPEKRFGSCMEFYQALDRKQLPIVPILGWAAAILLLLAGIGLLIPILKSSNPLKGSNTPKGRIQAWLQQIESMRKEQSEQERVARWNDWVNTPLQKKMEELEERKPELEENLKENSRKRMDAFVNYYGNGIDNACKTVQETLEARRKSLDILTDLRNGRNYLLLHLKLNEEEVKKEQRFADDVADFRKAQGILGAAETALKEGDGKLGMEAYSGISDAQRNEFLDLQRRIEENYRLVHDEVKERAKELGDKLKKAAVPEEWGASTQVLGWKIKHQILEKNLQDVAYFLDKQDYPSLQKAMSSMPSLEKEWSELLKAYEAIRGEVLELEKWVQKLKRLFVQCSDLIPILQNSLAFPAEQALRLENALKRFNDDLSRLKNSNDIGKRGMGLHGEILQLHGEILQICNERSTSRLKELAFTPDQKKELERLLKTDYDLFESKTREVDTAILNFKSEYAKEFDLHEIDYDTFEASMRAEKSALETLAADIVTLRKQFESLGNHLTEMVEAEKDALKAREHCEASRLKALRISKLDLVKELAPMIAEEAAGLLKQANESRDKAEELYQTATAENWRQAATLWSTAKNRYEDYLAKVYPSQEEIDGLRGRVTSLLLAVRQLPTSPEEKTRKPTLEDAEALFKNGLEYMVQEERLPEASSAFASAEKLLVVLKEQRIRESQRQEAEPEREKCSQNEQNAVRMWNSSDLKNLDPMDYAKAEKRLGDAKNTRGSAERLFGQRNYADALRDFKEANNLFEGFFETIMPALERLLKECESLLAEVQGLPPAPLNESASSLDEAKRLLEQGKAYKLDNRPVEARATLEQSKEKLEQLKWVRLMEACIRQGGMAIQNRDTTELENALKVLGGLAPEHPLLQTWRNLLVILQTIPAISTELQQGQFARATELLEKLPKEELPDNIQNEKERLDRICRLASELEKAERKGDYGESVLDQTRELLNLQPGCTLAIRIQREYARKKAEQLLSKLEKEVALLETRAGAARIPGLLNRAGLWRDIRDATQTLQERLSRLEGEVTEKMKELRTRTAAILREAAAILAEDEAVQNAIADLQAQAVSAEKLAIDDEAYALAWKTILARAEELLKHSPAETRITELAEKARKALELLTNLQELQQQFKKALLLTREDANYRETWQSILYAAKKLQEKLLSNKELQSMMNTAQEKLAPPKTVPTPKPVTQVAHLHISLGSGVELVLTQVKATAGSTGYPFWAGTVKVTQEQYQALLERIRPLLSNEQANAFKRLYKNTKLKNASWDSCWNWCDLLNMLPAATNLPEARDCEFRLPTAAEWEQLAPQLSDSRSGSPEWCLNEFKGKTARLIPKPQLFHVRGGRSESSLSTLPLSRVTIGGRYSGMNGEKCGFFFQPPPSPEGIRYKPVARTGKDGFSFRVILAPPVDYLE